MTDLDLQQNIVDTLQEMLTSKKITFPLFNKLKEMNVYKQDLPLKCDEDDELLRNYVVVIIGEQDVEDDEWNVRIHFSINIEDRDRDGSGDINVLYLMNEIYMYFIRKGIIGKHLKMEKKAYKVLDKEIEYPYYQGDLITTWKLPLPNEEGLEELI